MKILRAGPFAGIGYNGGLRYNLNLSDIGIGDTGHPSFSAGAPVNCAHHSVDGWLAGIRVQHKEGFSPYNDTIKWSLPSSNVTFEENFLFNTSNSTYLFWDMFFWYQASVPFNLVINWDAFTSVTNLDGTSIADSRGYFVNASGQIDLWNETEEERPTPPSFDTHAEVSSNGSTTITLGTAIVPKYCRLGGFSQVRGGSYISTATLMANVKMRLEPI